MYPIFSSTIKAFNSERRFLVSSYTASHGLLLLRSVRDDIHKTRVDILFQDVRALELRMWFDGIDIQVAPLSNGISLQTCPNDIAEPGNILYTIKSRDWSEYVLGGILRTSEDLRNSLDPSALIAST